MCIWSKGLVSCWAIISLKVQKVSIGTNFYPSTNYVPLDLCTLSMHRYRGNHITWPNRNEHIRLESWLLFNQCNSFVCMGYNSVCWIHDILCMHFQNLIITLTFMHACVSIITSQVPSDSTRSYRMYVYTYTLQKKNNIPVWLLKSHSDYTTIMLRWIANARLSHLCTQTMNTRIRLQAPPWVYLFEVFYQDIWSHHQNLDTQKGTILLNQSQLYRELYTYPLPPR